MPPVDSLSFAYPCTVALNRQRGPTIDGKDIPQEPDRQDLFQEPSSGRRRVLYLPRWAVIGAVLMLVVGLVGSMVRVPYFSVGPGPAVNMLKAIHIEDARTYPARGELLLTTALVSSRTLTLLESLVVWLKPTVSAIPERFLRAPGESDEEADAVNVADMELSKVSAEVAAFRALDIPVSPLPGGVVLSVVSGQAAEGKLRPGDRIVEVDGRRYATASAVQRAIGDRKPGDRVHLMVVRSGRRVEVVLRTKPARDDPSAPRIGVQLGTTYRLPHDVEIDSQDIGGPSGGLVFALALYERLEKDQITRGNVIAVTGAITDDGRVTPIGAVEEKARSLSEVGANVFVVPKGDLEKARRAASPSVMVIGVDSLYEAIVKLRALPPRR